MAMILCDSIGKLCSLPCQACAACTKGCGAICADVCRGCGPCCTECCRGWSVCCKTITQAICSPFFPYLFLTAVLNVPPTIWGIRARPGCGPSLWLWVNAAFCLAHIVVGLYAVTRILAARNGGTASTGTTTTNPTIAATTGMTTAAVVGDGTSQSAKPGDVESTNGPAAAARLRSRMTNLFTHERSYGETATAATSSNHGSSGREQMKQVLCYDPIIALYLLGMMGWLAWLFFGSVTVLSPDDDDNDDNCENNRNVVFLSIGAGFVYALLVCCTIPCAYACLR
jgi:hypothetical protein